MDFVPCIKIECHTFSAWSAFVRAYYTSEYSVSVKSVTLSVCTQLADSSQLLTVCIQRTQTLCPVLSIQKVVLPPSRLQH